MGKLKIYLHLLKILYYLLAKLLTTIKMVQRLCLRRRMSYSTLSNKRRISKTPGGKLVYLYQKKVAKLPVCGDTGVKLQGVKPARPTALKNMPKRHKRVSRAYGKPLRCCRPREDHPRLLDRGAEDRGESPEGTASCREGRQEEEETRQSRQVKDEEGRRPPRIGRFIFNILILLFNILIDKRLER